MGERVTNEHTGPDGGPDHARGPDNGESEEGVTRALELCQFSAISLPWLFGSAKSAEALVGSSAEDSALRAMWLNCLQQKRVEWWRSSRPRPPHPPRRVAEVARGLERKARRFERASLGSTKV